jgi:hypothetical protein
MTRTTRFLAALLASCCALLAFAALGSAQERLYAADGAQANPSRLYALDPASGAVLQTIGPIGFSVSGLAEDPSTGILYGSTGNSSAAGSLITINKATGAGTFVGQADPTNPDALPDITFTPDGALYGWWRGSNDLMSINKATGAGTVVGDSGVPNTFPAGGGLASNAAGTIFLAANGDNGPLRTVDRNTGAVTDVATLDGSGNSSIGALAFDAAGTLFGARIHFGGSCCPRPTDLITIDTTSGAISSRGPSIDGLDSIAFGHGPNRSVNLKKKKLKKGKKVRLSGQVTAPGNFAPCQAGQAVQLQRKKPKAASFAFFRQLTTDNAGNFSTKTKVKKTFKYRAFAPRSAVCADATSNVVKVKKPKKKKKK